MKAKQIVTALVIGLMAIGLPSVASAKQELNRTILPN